MSYLFVRSKLIIVPASAPIRSVAELKGKKVGVSRGSDNHHVLIAALKRAGLSLSDGDVAYLQAPEGAAAFEQGALDAWSIWAWFRASAADGFNLMLDVLPDSLETFVDTVIPILQRRGFFRTDYAGATLRDHLGLARPPARDQRARLSSRSA